MRRPDTRARALLAAATVVLAGTTGIASAGPARVGNSDALRLTPAAGTIFTIEGTYPRDPNLCPSKQRPPLRARYRGRLDISLSDGTVRIVDTLPFETYLYGLAEVPSSWPANALRAQAIAARSYALDAIRKERARTGDRGYDICSTDACQVYRGAAVELGPFGDRWVAAVDATRAKVLTYRGALVQAFYFSTSDGRTRRSFPGGTTRPFYPSVSGEDADAPLARWTVRVPFSDLTAIVRAAGVWRGGAITSAAPTASGVRLSDGERSESLARTALRDALNARAQCVFPTRYPTKGSATGGKLPVTVPGSTFSVRVASGELVLAGRGWGHGVGMSQWGSRSLAARGRSAAQILSHFYGPATITPASPPHTIRVLAADRLSTVRVLADGAFTATTPSGSRVSGDRFEIRGGTTLQIAHGIGPSLQPLLSIVPGSDALTATTGARLSVPFTVSGAATVTLIVMRNGAAVTTTEPSSFERGDASISIEAPVEPGGYQIVFRARDGIDDVRSAPISFAVAAPAPPPSPPSAVPTAWIFVAALGIVVVFGALRYARRRAQPKVKV